MIDYDQLSCSIIQRFNSGIYPLSAYSFQKDIGRLILTTDYLDKKIQIQSGNLIVKETELKLTLSCEFPRNQNIEEAKSIEQKMNTLFSRHCLGVKFYFQQSGNRKFFLMYLKLSMPHKLIEPDILDTYIVNNIIQDFFNDFVGYAPLWIGISTEYVSRCLKPLSETEKYFYPHWIRIGSKLINPDD